MTLAILKIATSPKPLVVHRIDKLVATAVFFPLLVVPISYVMAIQTYLSFPLGQFVKQVVWGTLMYSAYFATRYIPPRQASFVFWAFICVAGISVPVIFLQQIGVIGQFYWISNTVFLSSYLDASGISRFRNTGIFGYAHDAGDAMLLLVLAAYSFYLTTSDLRRRFLALAAMVVAFAALILTSSRGTMALGVISIVSSLLFLEPMITGRADAILSGVVRFLAVMFLATLGIWSFYAIWPDLFSSTLLFSRGFTFLTEEGRFSATWTAVTYLLSDPLRSFFGWGQGTGGLAPVQGIKILPVNTIDTTIASTLANFGLVGLIFYIFIFIRIIIALTRLRARLLKSMREGRERRIYVTISQFSILAIWTLLLSLIVGYSLTDRVYCNFAFLCIGALVARYELLLEWTERARKMNPHDPTPRTA